MSIFHETLSLTNSTVQEKVLKEGKGHPREAGGDLGFKLKRVRLYLAISSADCGGSH